MIDNLAPGSSSDSNIIDVSVATNNISGYVLTATAGNTSHTNTDLTKSGIENKFSSVATNADLSSITTDNTWGYSFSNNAGSSWTNYSGLPLYTAETGKELVSVDTNTVAPIKFKIAAKASTNQPAGTYTNVINFIAVANPEPELGPVGCTAGKICYQPNALSGVVGAMGEQTAADGNTVTLLASNFSRTGYGFAGWSDVYDYDTNANAHFYGPQEDITVPTGTTANGTSLYAVWVKSAGSMQSSSVSQICNSLTQAPTDGTANLSSVTALTDQRDHQTYAIAKLADGNCWMIENLRLEAENTRTPEKQALAQGYGTSATYGNFGGLANAESANFTDSTTANSLYYSGTQVGTASIDIGTSNRPAYRMPRYNNWNNQSASANRPQDPTTNSATNSTTNAGMYSYGNYYTWAAAIADLTYNDTNNQSTTGTSLCPAGWHLPTGGLAYASGSTSGVNVTGNTSTFREFYNLGYKTMDEVKTAYEDTPNSGYAYYSSNTTNTAGKTATAAIRSFPNNFLYSGNFVGSSAQNRGSRGSYWSSTVSSYYNSYVLYLGSSYVYPGTNFGSKSFGQSIRCTVGS